MADLSSVKIRSTVKHKQRAIAIFVVVRNNKSVYTHNRIHKCFFVADELIFSILFLSIKFNYICFCDTAVVKEKKKYTREITEICLNEKITLVTLAANKYNG